MKLNNEKFIVRCIFAIYISRVEHQLTLCHRFLLRTVSTAKRVYQMKMNGSRLTRFTSVDATRLRANKASMAAPMLIHQFLQASPSLTQEVQR